jgi:hypothetical protein
MSGSTLLLAVYGYEVTSAHDPLVELVETALDHLCDAAIPASKLIRTAINETPKASVCRLFCQHNALAAVLSRMVPRNGVEADCESMAEGER